MTDSRVAAAEILADVRRGELLDRTLDRHATALDPRDRRWTQELVYGLMRHRGSIDVWLDARARGGTARLDADLADLIRCGVYQLLYMDSVPPYAAIGQTVELVKRRHHKAAAGLANAVLRRIDRERSQLPAETAALADPVRRLAAQCSHPEWLVARWLTRWGATETERLLAHNNSEAPLVLRPFGVDAAELRRALDEAGITAGTSPLVDDSLVLDRSTSVSSLPGYATGHFFVQDPGATLVTRFASVAPGARVLDLCAAPGGKTLELARLASRVTAVDASAARLDRLRQNLERLRVTNVTLQPGDARDVEHAPVDLVLVDAPCTGTGTFRRHPDARWRLQPSDVALSPVTQRALLDQATHGVAPGGLLVYSTCSLEPEENDQVADAFLAAHPEFVEEPPPEGAVPAMVMDRGRLRVLPHHHDADGSFAVRFRRRAGWS